MPSIKVLSSDGEIFDVEIAKQSVTIKTMSEDLRMDDADNDAAPLPNVNVAIFLKESPHLSAYQNHLGKI
uniref:SKP1 component POZ domain-containing protein n=1 Tax=Theropithecus gelada TaxID=9565 RepID=A0A8D2GB12_THEGE